jgi:hypothetical protein
MKNTVLSAAGLLVVASMSAHVPADLVTSGGFELTTALPYTCDQPKLAQGWSTITIGLSDVFGSSAAAKAV